MGTAAVLDESGVVGHVKIGGIEFAIFNSQIDTTLNPKAIDKKLYRTAYVELTGDDRKDVDPVAVRHVVISHLQLAWYEFHKIVVPERTMIQHRQYIALARRSTVKDDTETAAAIPRGELEFRSAKAVVRHALANGWTKEAAIARMTALFPEAKVPHARTYIWCLHRHEKGQEY